ncbi:hypothetical protein DENIS_1705 [Desulfonema ishimotonii]|uniref:Uncharacterized protein n=1 Tax=Desulfonema ishimotonii TaxID=45657 RepID=A0A401FUU9_9BACT|nr:patatin-like phospholipase family protein [Desulfonema ishimotonii]GBC60746.1 hypothetical protein DENIS_1705 [Desulfonema ishimotonii]
MSQNLVFRAGRKAYISIKQNGLSADAVKVVAGAAGGPKFLVLSGLDRILFTSWFAGRTEPLFLLGASIGTWRFAAAARNHPADAMTSFRSAYIRQRYSDRPTPAEITRGSEKILSGFLGKTGASEVLNHPYLRLNILAVRSGRAVSSLRQIPMTLGLLGAALANVADRRLLRFFFGRTLFHDPRTRPPFWGMNEFPVQKVRLDAANLRKALLASGSIPLVMDGVGDIPGAQAGIYRDGGVIDYHLNLPFMPGKEGIVLYPHYTDRIIPGWLDKTLRWRRPSPRYMENVLMVAPSQRFVENLPHRKIPDRSDFYRFRGHDAERMLYWKQVVRVSRQLADEFLDTVETGAIRERVVPIC